MGGDIIEVGHRPCRLAECRMAGDILDLLAVDEDAPAVVERTQIFGTCTHWPPPLLRPDYSVAPARRLNKRRCGIGCFSSIRPETPPIGRWYARRGRR